MKQARSSRSSLRTQHIDSFLEKKQGDTGKILAFITPDYERTFAVDLGNSRDYDALPSKGIKNSNFLYLTSIMFLTKGRMAKSARDAIEFAKKNNVRVSLSLESPPMINKNKTKLQKIVSRADMLFANEEELEALVGSKHDEAARALAEDINTVCLKKRNKRFGHLFSWRAIFNSVLFYKSRGYNWGRRLLCGGCSVQLKPRAIG